MTTPPPLSIERIGYITEYNITDPPVQRIEEMILRQLVEAAVGKLQPSPTFVIYQVLKEQDGQIVLTDKLGNKVNDTDRAPFIFYVFDKDDNNSVKQPDPFFAYYAAHCFMLFILEKGVGVTLTLNDFRKSVPLTDNPPQQGLAIVDVNDLGNLNFVPDGVHSMEAIPIVREALLKVYLPPPPQGKEEKKRTRRPYILVVVITLIILLGLIGGVVYMAF
jgi:hypothetical protein